MSRKYFIIFLIIVTGGISSCGIKQSHIGSMASQDLEETPAQTRSELVMRSLTQAYPEHIKKVEFRNDDWAILLRETWYYFAGGRILPENQLENIDNFRPMQFYSYPAELPLWRERNTEEIERFRNVTTVRSQARTSRANFFLDDLWQASNRAETETHQRRISFLGRSVTMNISIHGKINRIEEQILAAAENDPLVKTWIDNLGTVDGYGWRNIADTQARSYHSYGIAIDLLPRSLGGKQTYWLWTIRHREDWWNVSYDERYHPPAQVIKAFEDNGFIWGGKWMLFDTMHFEYRPEILIFNGFEI